MAVDGILAIIGEEGADIQALLNGGSGGETPAAEQAAAPDSGPANAARPAEAPATGQAAPAAAAPASNGRILASPLAKSIAREKGINLAQVKGSGDNGRIVQRDVENFQPALPRPPRRLCQPPQLLPAQPQPPQLLPTRPRKPTPTRRCRKCAKSLPSACPKACSRPRISI